MEMAWYFFFAIDFTAGAHIKTNNEIFASSVFA